jgi:hypothetical protein
MKRLWRASLTLGLMLMSEFEGFSQSVAAGSPVSTNTQRKLQIRVRVDNRVGMPSNGMSQAEEVATQILWHAGVQVLWLDCSSTVTTSRSQSCDDPLQSTDFIVNFVEEIRSLSPKVSDDTLGFAMVPDGGGQANRAYISNHRAHVVAGDAHVSPEIVLGIAAAHELGHLLTGLQEHSRSGLMRAQWDAKDLQRAEKGDLQFTEDQMKQITAGLLAGIAQQNAARLQATVPH